MFRRIRARHVQAFAIAAFVGVLAGYLWPPTANDPATKGPFVALEQIGFGGMFRLRGPRPDRIDPRIAVVGVTRESEINFGQNWPFDRGLHAKLIEKLNEDGARLIVFDVLFSGGTDPKFDKELDAVLKKHDNVVLSMRIDRDPVLQRKSIEGPFYDDALGVDFEANTIAGVAEVQLDNDDVIRKFLPALKFQDEWLPSLATAAYLKFYGIPASSLVITDDLVQIGNQRFDRIAATTVDPIDKSIISSMLVDFPAGKDAFFSDFSYDQVVNGQFKKGSYKDKVVFVGVTGYEIARGLQDVYVISSTQLGADVSGIEADLEYGNVFYNRVPGVFIQAHFFNALMQNGFFSYAPRWRVGALTGFFVLAGIYVVRRYMNWRGPVAFVILAMTYLTAAYVMFDRYQQYLPYVVPLLLISLSVGTVAWVERGSLRKRWSRYVSPQVLEQILQTEGDVYAKRVVATAMFGDVRGFTSFSDKHDAEKVVRLLNMHFERFTDIVYAEGGTIDKFMGDGILVVFGAPMPLKDHELHAVRAAVKMRDISLVPLVDDGEEFVLSTGVGLATGAFVAGHIGSQKRHDFTVIGDVVNIAARLQGVTGESDVIIDEATYEIVKDHVEAESLGQIELKGKPLPLQCYKVLRMKE